MLFRSTTNTYVFVVIHHRSRRLVHFNVTAHPTSAWTLQQLIDNEPLNQAIYALAQKGDMQPFVDNVSHILKNLLSNRDAQKFHEGSLKAIFVSLLQQQKFYYIHSEYESSRRYMDIFLETIRGYSPKFEIAIELKYVKKADKANSAALLDEAEVQLTAYMVSRKFHLRPNVKAFVIVVQGYKVTWRAV